jgi:hypothetical protein
MIIDMGVKLALRNLRGEMLDRRGIINIQGRTIYIGILSQPPEPLLTPEQFKTLSGALERLELANPAPDTGHR